MSAAKTALEAKSARPNAAPTPEHKYADFLLIIRSPEIEVESPRFSQEIPNDAARRNGLALHLTNWSKRSRGCSAKSSEFLRSSAGSQDPAKDASSVEQNR